MFAQITPPMARQCLTAATAAQLLPHQSLRQQRLSLVHRFLATMVSATSLPQCRLITSLLRCSAERQTQCLLYPLLLAMQQSLALTQINFFPIAVSLDTQTGHSTNAADNNLPLNMCQIGTQTAFTLQEPCANAAWTTFNALKTPSAYPSETTQLNWINQALALIPAASQPVLMCRRSSSVKRTLRALSQLDQRCYEFISGGRHRSLGRSVSSREHIGQFTHDSQLACYGRQPAVQTNHKQCRHCGRRNPEYSLRTINAPSSGLYRLQDYKGRLRSGPVYWTIGTTVH